jgi:hypothetical protein
MSSAHRDRGHLSAACFDTSNQGSEPRLGGRRRASSSRSADIAGRVKQTSGLPSCSCGNCAAV